jgi:hypothetical protein
MSKMLKLDSQRPLLTSRSKVKSHGNQAVFEQQR